jgi:nucleoside-diphosphate-sugar epimerase
MRVFLTGATGYIGSAVAGALRAREHEVAALVRAESDTRVLRDLGVVLVTGELMTLPSLSDTLAGYDAFVHVAAAANERAERDAAAVDTFTAMNKPFVYTSGVWVLGNTEKSDERSPVNPLELVSWRPAHEERVLGAGGAVMRPGCVYGGTQSLLKDWFAAAEQNRPLQIVGEGNNRWAMVNIHDLADLYVRAIEQRANGILHGIDDTSDTLDECAKAIAPNGSIEHIPLDAARTSYGPFADALAIDQRIESRLTRERTGWNPRRTFTTSVEEQWQEWRTQSQTR